MTSAAPLDRVADFPAIPDGWAYLDTAATAQKPQAVIDAITRAYDTSYATVHRGVYQRSADMTVAYEKAREGLSAINTVRLLGPEDSAGIVSFAVEGVHPHDIGTILDESRVAIRAGHHCAQPLMDALGLPATARASFGVYNGPDDVAALVDGVRRVTRIFG